MKRALLMRFGLCLLLALGAVASGPGAAAAKTSNDRLEIALDRARVSTHIGDSFHFSSTVLNSGGTPVSGLVAHLNIVSLRKGVYVDPEDWSSRRTQYLAPLAPGKLVKLRWSVEAVNSGDFAIYVVLIPGNNPQNEPLSASPGIALHSTEQKTLNSGGVLPLVLGVPALLGLLTLGLRARRR